MTSINETMIEKSFKMELDSKVKKRTMLYKILCNTIKKWKLKYSEQLTRLRVVTQTYPFFQEYMLC